jgi:hypothetical protein
VFGPLGVMGLFIFGLFTLILGVRDLFSPTYLGRITPEKGARAFLGGLCGKRYKFAYACLLEADKDGLARLRPALAKFDVAAKTCSFSIYEGFRDYWKGLLHYKGTQAGVGKIRLQRSAGDLAEVTAEISLNRHSTTGFLAFGILGAMLMGTRDKLQVRKLLRQVNGQWYVVNGELDSAEDRFGMGGAETEPAKAKR